MNNTELSNKEQIFKDIAGDIQFNIDTNALWDQIENRVPTTNKDTRKTLWLWIIGAIILSFTAGVYYSTNQNQKTSNVKIIDNKKAEVPFFTSKEELQKEKTITLEYATKEDLKNIYETERKKIVTVNKKRFSTISNSFSNVISTKSNNKKALNINTYNNQSITKASTIETRISTIADNTNSHLKAPSIHTKIQNNNRVQVANLKGLKPLNSPLPNQNERIIISPTEIAGLIALNKNIRWKPFFAISTGINQNKAKYAVLSDQEPHHRLFGHESGKIGLSTDILFGQSNQNGWEWHFGLSYQMIVSRYQNNTSTTTSMIIDGPQSAHIDKNGIIKTQNGPIQVTQTNQYDITWHRQHQLLDLKLGFGKQLLSIRNFDLGIRTGLGYTLLSHHQGYYFEEGNTNITKIENNNHPYINNGLIKAYGNLNIGYNWNKFTFEIGINYSQDLNSTTKKSNYYTLKNSQYGIQFTTVYRPY